MAAGLHDVAHGQLPLNVAGKHIVRKLQARLGGVPARGKAGQVGHVVGHASRGRDDGRDRVSHVREGEHVGAVDVAQRGQGSGVKPARPLQREAGLVAGRERDAAHLAGQGRKVRLRHVRTQERVPLAGRGGALAGVHAQVPAEVADSSQGNGTQVGGYERVHVRGAEGVCGKGRQDARPQASVGEKRHVGGPQLRAGLPEAQRERAPGGGAAVEDLGRERVRQRPLGGGVHVADEQGLLQGRRLRGHLSPGGQHEARARERLRVVAAERAHAADPGAGGARVRQKAGVRQGRAQRGGGVVHGEAIGREVENDVDVVVVLVVVIEVVVAAGNAQTAAGELHLGQGTRRGRAAAGGHGRACGHGVLQEGREAKRPHVAVDDEHGLGRGRAVHGRGRNEAWAGEPLRQARERLGQVKEEPLAVHVGHPRRAGEHVHGKDQQVDAPVGSTARVGRHAVRGSGKVAREAPQLRDAQSHVMLLVRGRSFEYTARSARMPDPGQPDTSPMAQSYAAQRALPP